ncbi:MAG: Ig-like domain-containing protein, partial [Acidobacteriota bacterium]
SDIGAGTVGPGDAFKYRITVSNTGGDALGLTIEVDPGLDANTTVSSVQTQPIGVDDNYQGFGNVTLDVPAASGALGNDLDPDGDTPRVDIANSAAASAQGGTVTWNDVGGGLGDGAFTYAPPAGFRGIDTFTYQVIDDDARVDTATVSVRLETTVWFVDNTSGGTNIGTLGNPFQSITATNLNGAAGAGDQDGPGDIIFFFSGAGSYAGGLELEDRQLVLGPEDGLILDGHVLIPDTDDARPTLTAAAGNALTLASDNELRALNIGNTPTGVGIAGSNFGTFTASQVAISGSGGAVDLDNGTSAATFESIASTNGTLGIDLDAVDGSFVVSGSTTINGTSGTGIRVVNGGSTYDFG